MFNQFTIIFGRQWQSYTIALLLGIVLSFAWMVYRAPKNERTKTVDVCLSALIGAVIVGRLLHVSLNWAFFVDRIDLIYEIHREGGLNWHGAVIGALVTGYLMARLRGISTQHLVKNAVIILPLLSFFAYYACATAGCAYGLPVERMADYPRWMTWIADDIYRLNMPRFATQPLGMFGSGILFILACLLYWRGWLIKIRFWLMLFLIALLSFGISFLRGDYALEFSGLVIGQWLDLGLMLIAITLPIRALYNRIGS